MLLPPYGAPSRELAIVDDGARPGDWPASADWQAYYDTFVEDVATHIWPKWDPKHINGPWVGPSAAFCYESTRRELELTVETLYAPGVIEQNPQTPGYSGELIPRDHYWHYAIEDFIGCFAEDLQRRYPPAAPEHVALEREACSFPSTNLYYYDNTLKIEDLRPLFLKMFAQKYNGIFQTKLIFRRPRPQQVAFMMGIDGFEHRQARANIHTGRHPALISGHCAQGLLVICTLIDDLLESGRTLESMPLEAYGHYAVDFGDRRVLAGVHYPTDNLSSWLAVMRLIPFVFEKRGVYLAKFIANALINKSIVYKMIDGPFSAPDSPYPGAWALFQKELQIALARDD